MELQNPGVDTINEAFELLPEEIRSHSRRVQAYVEAAFRKLVTMDLYISDPRSSVELQIENIRSISSGALYHDIGKLLPEEDVADEDGKVVHKEHCLLGAELAQKLPPAEGKFLPTERRIYLTAIREHHEYLCGGGEPTGAGLKDLAFGGRIVAIADRLDHLAMELHVEDPVSKALELLKEEVKAGRLDPEFYKAYKLVKGKLKKTFDEYRGEAEAALPENDPFIPRKAHRPMELHYLDHRMELEGEVQLVREAVMRFRNHKPEMMSYRDLKSVIADSKQGPDLGRYFTYELLDAIRRFATVKAEASRYVIELPHAWYANADFARETLRALQSEQVPAEKILLILPDDLTKPQQTAFGKQQERLREAGVLTLPRLAFEGLRVASYAGGDENAPLPPERTEEDIVTEALKAEGGEA